VYRKKKRQKKFNQFLTPEKGFKIGLARILNPSPSTYLPQNKTSNPRRPYFETIIMYIKSYHFPPLTTYMDMKRHIMSIEYNKIKFETYINNDELFKIVREHTRELKSGEKGV
jgi:hypothetical protein